MIKFAKKHCGECYMNVELMGSSYYGIKACMRFGSGVGVYFLL